MLGTPDLAGTVPLLTEGLGFRLTDSVEGTITFLRCSTDHHNVAVVESPVPLLHYNSWECDDVGHVGHAASALYRMLPDRHVWGMGRHFAGSNFFSEELDTKEFLPVDEMERVSCSASCPGLFSRLQEVYQIGRAHV